MELKAPKAIIFDWDNTLVDTWPTIHEALNTTFSRMGTDLWTIDTVKKRVSRSMRDSFPDIFGQNWEEAGQIYQSSFRAIHLERLSALPEARTLLEWLSNKPVYLAIASNKRGDNLRKEVTHIGWDKYFGKVIGADDTPADKPAPQPVYAALEGSGISAGNEVWFIGDSEVDMACAHASGCTPIFYGELPQDPLKHPFVKQVASHTELIKLLDTVLG